MRWGADMENGHLTIPGFLFGYDERSLYITSALCMLAVVITAYRRYTILEVNFETHQFKKHTRIWTTGIRFILSSLVYIFITAFLFRLLIETPDLVTFLLENLGISIPFSPQNIDVALPIGVAILLYVAPKVPPFRAVDRSLRAVLQRFGAIPSRVRSIMVRLEQSDLQPPASITGHSPEGISNSPIPEIIGPGTDSLETKMNRAAAMQAMMNQWARTDSEFNVYHNEHKTALDQIGAAYESLKDKCDNAIAGHKASDAPEDTSPLEPCRPKIDEVLMYQHMAFASALLSKTWKGRIPASTLRLHGFSEPTQITPTEAPVRDRVLGEAALNIANDFGFLILFLLFVVYPVLFFTMHFGFGYQPTELIDGVDQPEPWWVPALLWPVKIVGIIASIAGPAIFLKVRLHTSESRFWRKLSEREGRNYLIYAVSGITSFVLAGAFLFLGEVLGPYPVEFSQALLGSMGSALFALAVAVGLTFSFETPEAGRLQEWGEAVAIGFAGAILGTVGFVATHSAAEQGNWPYVAVFCFAVAAATGKLLPTAFRANIQPDLDGGTQRANESR